MSSPLNATTLLDQEYLEIREKILQLAASFDRIDRADGREEIDDDARWAKLRQAVDVLGTGGSGRAERVQMVFSLPYAKHWPEQLGVTLPNS